MAGSGRSCGRGLSRHILKKWGFIEFNVKEFENMVAEWFIPDDCGVIYIPNRGPSGQMASPASSEAWWCPCLTEDHQVWAVPAPRQTCSVSALGVCFLFINIMLFPWMSNASLHQQLGCLTRIFSPMHGLP